MNDYLNSYRLRNQEKLDMDQMDQKHIELSSMFEFSQTLNSSLDIKTILDNLLFVPMGRLMISKGMIILATAENKCRVATVKGLPAELINNEFKYEKKPSDALLIDGNTEQGPFPALFYKYNLKVIIPIKSMNKVQGMMILGPKLVQKDFTEDEIHFLASIGNIAAPAIHNAQVFEELTAVNYKLDHKIQELSTLSEIGNELNRVFELDEILKKLSFSLMGQMLINQFFVATMEEGQLSVVYKKGSVFTEENVNKCIDAGAHIVGLLKPLVINDINKQEYSIFCDYNIRVIVPMIVQESIRGYIFLGPKLNKLDFSESDIGFLATLGNIAIISIENARLFKETLEKKRLEEELNVAKEIQARLLPSIMPVIAGYDIHGYNIPSKHVGGDYYDILKLNESEYILTIADVSGKGMPASLLMSNLQAGLHTLHKEDYSLAEITYRLNNLVFQNTTIEKYITFFIAKLNINDHKLTYVNAGHNPPYVFYADGTYEELSDGGIILGMMADVPYETGEVILKPSCCLTMFTDGVTEAMTLQEIPFDEFRVIEFFQQQTKGLDSKKINMKLIDVLYDFAGDPTKDDDITILTLQRKK